MPWRRAAIVFLSIFFSLAMSHKVMNLKMEIQSEFGTSLTDHEHSQTYSPRFSCRFSIAWTSYRVILEKVSFGIFRCILFSKEEKKITIEIKVKVLSLSKFSLYFVAVSASSPQLLAHGRYLLASITRFHRLLRVFAHPNCLLIAIICLL